MTELNNKLQRKEPLLAATSSKLFTPSNTSINFIEFFIEDFTRLQNTNLNNIECLIPIMSPTQTYSYLIKKKRRNHQL